MLLPAASLVAGSVVFAVVGGAQGHREFVTDLDGKASWLRNSAHDEHGTIYGHRSGRAVEPRPDDYAVKVELPTDRGVRGPYNGRSYDSLYLLKGGGRKVWKLFPRIRKEWRKPQGVIFGKRCGCTRHVIGSRYKP
jgi:hypothetical protein